MGRYPALDVGGADSDLVLAVVDDYSPTAVEEQQDGSLTVYFSDPLLRNHARDAIAHAFPTALISVRDVDDGDWARRSQESLGPVTVGRITVAPPWSQHSFNGAGAPPPARTYDDALASASPGLGSAWPQALSDGAGAALPAPSYDNASPPGSAWPQALPPELPDPSALPDPSDLPNPPDPPDPPGLPDHFTVIIQPSMGFGTGHHATTRLCLAALQTRDLTGALVLDVGTGSGVLALAARALGAQQVVGIDNDPDAVECALENLTLNPELDQVVFEIRDLQAVPLAALKGPRADVSGDFNNHDREQGPCVAEAADVITANLTGALLCRAAPTLVSALAPGGVLIVSGLLANERGEVINALRELTLTREEEEDGWVGLVFEKSARELKVGQEGPVSDVLF